MKDLRKNKTNTDLDLVIFLASIASLLYYTFMSLNTHYFNFDNVILIGVQQLITLPLMLGTLVMMGLTIKSLVTNKFSIKTYAFGSVIILTGTIILLISWFVK